MRAQTTDYNCGPASVQNALKTFGRHVSQARIAELARTDPENGTDEYGIQNAVTQLGFRFSVLETDVRYHALDGLEKLSPTLLCLDRWSHWVTCLGWCGTGYLIVDPARTHHMIRENHLVVLSQRRLLRRWYAARKVRGTGPRYYGVRIWY